MAPVDIAREERRFRLLFDRGIPTLRQEALLTELGDAVLTSIEQATR